MQSQRTHLARRNFMRTTLTRESFGLAGSMVTPHKVYGLLSTPGLSGNASESILGSVDWSRDKSVSFNSYRYWRSSTLNALRASHSVEVNFLVSSFCGSSISTSTVPSALDV